MPEDAKPIEQTVPLRSHRLRWVAIAGTLVRSFDRTRASLNRLAAEPIYVFWGTFLRDCDLPRDLCSSLSDQCQYDAL